MTNTSKPAKKLHSNPHFKLLKTNLYFKVNILSYTKAKHEWLKNIPSNLIIQFSLYVVLIRALTKEIQFSFSHYFLPLQFVPHFRKYIKKVLPFFTRLFCLVIDKNPFSLKTTLWLDGFQYFANCLIGLLLVEVCPN